MFLSSVTLVAALVLALAQAGFGAPRSVAGQYGPMLGQRPAALALSSADEMTALFDDLLPQQLADQDIPGATVALVGDGRTLVARGYGYANLEQRTPVDADQTLFRVGSIAKLVTWTAVMQLVEQGRLDLHTDINTYLIDFQIPATYQQPITMAHLLAHTAGFEERQLGITVHQPDALLPLGAYLAKSMPARIYPPGDVTAYSNYGAALAGYIVEVVSGKPFAQYVERHIFAPLGMSHSSFAQPLPHDLAEDLAASYRYDQVYHPVPFEYFQIAPSAALTTTATDMARFMLAHLNDGTLGERRVLAAENVREMHRRHFANDPRVNGMAYGFAEMTLNGRRLLVHSGTTNDELFRSLLVIMPKEQLGLFVSYSGAGGGDAKWELLQALLDRLYPAAVPPAPAPPADFEQRSGRYAGSYQSTRAALTTLEKAGALLAPEVRVRAAGDGYLTITGLSKEPTRWVETEPLVFRDVNSADTLVFRADSQGQITHLFQGNLPITGFRKSAWYEALTLHYALLAGCVALFVGTLIGALIGSVFGRRRRGVAESRLAPLARRLVWTVYTLDLLFLALFAASLTDLSAYPSSLLLLALTTGLVASLASVAVAVCAVFAWRQRLWSVGGRTRYSLLALGALAFVWFLNAWNLLGYRL